MLNYSSTHHFLPLFSQIFRKSIFQATSPNTQVNYKMPVQFMQTCGQARSIRPNQIQQIKQFFPHLYNFMDLQDNQPVQNRQDSQQPNSNNISSSSSSSVIRQPNQPAVEDNQQDPDSPEPEVRLPASISELPENIPKHTLPSIRSEPALEQRQQKSKRRKVRAYVQDFTEYLPESLIIVNKTVIPAIVRKGERYQVNVPKAPPLKTAYRPMEEWVVWKGSSCPEQQPTQDQLLRFKELLGENRTEEEFIHIRQKLGMNSWKEVLEYIGRSKGEMRRIFHMAQRNRI